MASRNSPQCTLFWLRLEVKVHYVNFSIDYYFVAAWLRLCGGSSYRAGLSIVLCETIHKSGGSSKFRHLKQITWCSVLSPYHAPPVDLWLGHLGFVSKLLGPCSEDTNVNNAWKLNASDPKDGHNICSEKHNEKTAECPDAASWMSVVERFDRACV